MCFNAESSILTFLIGLVGLTVLIKYPENKLKLKILHLDIF